MNSMGLDTSDTSGFLAERREPSRRDFIVGYPSQIRGVVLHLGAILFELDTSAKVLHW
jgi:hypothetical protein